MRTEHLLRRAIERGLAAADFEQMTVGMVIDYLIVSQNEDVEAREQEKRGPVRQATQADIDAW